MQLRTGLHRESAIETNDENTPGWIRTNGFLLRRQALYPLSYRRV